MDVQHVPNDVRKHAKTLIMHHLYTGFSGINEYESQVALQLLNKYMLYEGNCSILGQQKKSSPIGAAFANGVLMHSIQQEDTYKGLHPGPHVLPVSFSLGEELLLDGHQILSSIIAGYETNIVIGDLCAKHTSPRGWRGTTIFGVLGAAAAGARVLQLNQEKTVHAIANSINLASGLMECWLAGTSEWLFTSGISAQNGVISSLLAKEGADGAKTSFEGDRGFFKAYCGVQPENVVSDLEQLGKRYNIPEVSLKSYPVITTILPVIHNVVQLINTNNIVNSKIKSVHIIAGLRVTKGPLQSSILDSGPFINKTQAYKSIPCATGIALRYGNVTGRTVEYFQDKDVAHLAKQVKITSDESYEGFYNTVSITTEDGSNFEISGDEFPSLTAEQVIMNLRNSATKYLSMEKIDALIERINRIENIPMSEISECLS